MSKAKEMLEYLPSTSQSIAEEVLDRVLSKEINNFIENLIKDGQKIHKLVEDRIKEVERINNNPKMKGKVDYMKVDYPSLRKHMKELVKERWGEDAMTPLLVRLLVDGDFVY